MTVMNHANTAVGAVDKSLGNKEGWSEVAIKSTDEGVATTVLAAFSPFLKGTAPVLHLLQ